MMGLGAENNNNMWPDICRDAHLLWGTVEGEAPDVCGNQVDKAARRCNEARVRVD